MARVKKGEGTLLEHDLLLALSWQAAPLMSSACSGIINQAAGRIPVPEPSAPLRHPQRPTALGALYGDLV